MPEPMLDYVDIQLARQTLLFKLKKKKKRKFNFNFFLNQFLVKEKTGSSKGSAILKEWDTYLPLFWQLVPPSEEDTPEACADYEKTGAGQVTLQSA